MITYKYAFSLSLAKIRKVLKTTILFLKKMIKEENARP
jgi:hypothetical protein